MILPPTVLHFPAIRGNVKHTNHPRNNDAAQNSRDSLPEPLTECQPTPDWTWVSLRSPPEWGEEGPSVDPAPPAWAAHPPVPPGGLYLYLWALTRKMHSKTARRGRLLEFYWLVSLVRVSKHLHQISNYLTFPLENLTSLEHLNLNFQVTSQQVYRNFFLFHTLR